jgi:stage V sporulation protein R
MLNEFANHGTRIRRYMSRWGKERVIEFIDHVLRIETLVDNAKAWNTRQVKEPIIRDHRKYRQPRRMQTDKSRMYMDDWINTKDFVDAEHKRIEKADKADELGLMLKPEKDIFGWIRENANLKPWQSDIMAMLYEEAMYYAPQGMTKMHNEGHACLVSGQYVFTDSGMITADKIVVDKMECNVFDGEVQQKVVNHFVFENRKTYKITTKRGYVIHGSDTHRIFDKNKNWIRLDEVKIGDQAYIAAGSNIWAQGYVELNYQDFERITGRQVAELAGCSFDTVRRRMAGENTRINSKLDDLILNYKNQLETHGRRKQKPQIDANIPTIVDENLGEFLGYLIGDGHISISGRCFGLTTADYDMVVKFSSLVENIFGLECKIKKVPGKYRVHAYSRKVERFLVSLGLTTGVSARQKSIPDCILRSPKSVISKFISALLDCDGYGGKGGVILSTSSKKMASQIQLLFLNYGIVSSITNQPKDILHVRFGGSYLKLFVKEIGFGLKRKQDKLQKFIDSHQWFCKTYDYDTVVKIEEGRHTVYDISVENTHRYAAQGFINHNSWVDYNIIAKQGLCALGQEAHDHGIVEYAKHKMGVLGGKYSTNPYKLGFCLLTEIEERWNKGMFGNEWEDVSSYKEKENWDKKLGLGKEKVFEIAKLYDDVNLINEFFTQDFCDKYQFFDWQKQENGEYVVQSKDANVIKRKLIEKYSNRGLPTINLVDNNHLGKGIMLLEHVWNGRTLYIPYVNETLGSINFLTGRPVLLASKNKNGEEIVFYCEGFGDSQVHQLTRLQYKREFGISV